jgi:hypothetical protein
MSDLASQVDKDDALSWYASCLRRGVAPELLQHRLELTERLFDASERLYDAVDELQNYLCLLLEGSPATALRVGRPDTKRASDDFLAAVGDTARELGLDGDELTPMERQ